MATRHRLELPVLIAALLLAGCGSQPSSAAVASPHPSRATSVSSAALLAYTAKGTDLGPGWTDTPSANGTDLTIDNGGHPCHQPYPSDALRQAKNDVTILNPSDPSKVANDVVYYRDHGAEQALKDMHGAVDGCSSYTNVNAEGGTISIDVHISEASSSSLGDERIAVDYRLTLGSRTIYAVVFSVRVGEYVTTVHTVSGDPAKAGRLAGLAAVASTTRLKAAPAA